jgi:hypothetical protein
MTNIQPELWVETPAEAIAFYEAAFEARVLHRVGDGNDIVAQLGVGEAAFWVAPTSATMKRLSPRANRWRDQQGAARGERPRRRPPPGGRRWRDGIVASGQRARLAAGPNHRPIRPRVGDRRAFGSLAAELSGARGPRPAKPRRPQSQPEKMAPLWPLGCCRRPPVANRTSSESAETSEGVAVGCDPLPEAG